MRKLFVPVLMGLALSTTGCEQTRQTLGLKRTQVDEFQVEERQPLSVPPDYALRPPKPNAPPTTEVAPSDKAKEALIGDQAANKTSSLAEKNILTQALAQNNNAKIRDQLSRDNSTAKEGDQSFGETLVFWKDKTSHKTGSVIDPVAEQKHYNG